MIFHSHSLEETLALGRRIGTLAPPGTCVTLEGPLGAGKTQLARGIALGAKIDDPDLVSSPTYVLLNIYPGEKPVFHLDAYRIHSPEDFAAVGLEEWLSAGGITVIEWPEKIAALLPEDRLRIQIVHAGDTERALTFSSSGTSADLLLQKLSEGAGG